MSEKKIIYNGEKYANTVLNSQGVGEFTSNSGQKSTGSNNERFNDYVHNIADGTYSHAEGYDTKTYGAMNHVEGKNNLIRAGISHVEGYDNNTNFTNFSEEESYSVGDIVLRSGNLYQCKEAVSAGSWDSTKWNSFSTFMNSYILNSTYSSNRDIRGAFDTDGALYTAGLHVEGTMNLAVGVDGTHAEGEGNIVKGTTHHIEGMNNILAARDSCHVEGKYNTTIINNVAANVDAIHVEGFNNKSNSANSHTEGSQNETISSAAAHVEGQDNTVNYAYCSHIEGYGNQLNGIGSDNINTIHVEGGFNIIGKGSNYGHVEGHANTINDNVMYYHVSGLSNICTGNSQTIIGKYNNPGSAGEENKYAFIIGNGTSAQNRSNALTLDWNGVLNAAGEVKTNGSTLAKDSSLAPAYSNSNTYYKDFYVTKDNTLYKSNVVISTAEDWDSIHWDSTTLGTELFGYIQGANGRFTSAENRITALENGGGGGDIANPNISDAYDDTVTYSEGDYCIYSNTLYKANTDISTAESWTAAHWTSTTVGEELLSLITRIEALESLPNLDSQSF